MKPSPLLPPLTTPNKSTAKGSDRSPSSLSVPSTPSHTPTKEGDRSRECEQDAITRARAKRTYESREIQKQTDWHRRHGFTHLYQWGPAEWRYIAPVDALTIGYGNHSLDEMIEKVNQSLKYLNPLLVDIRYRPDSGREGWDDKTLTKRLGWRYKQLPQWGNIARFQGEDGAIEIADFSSGLEAFEAYCIMGHTPILLCACGDPDHCHRQVVRESLEAIGWTLQEVMWPEHR